MKLPPLLAMGCFFPASRSTTLRSRQLDDPGYLSSFVFPNWAITNFDGSCSPGGCLLSFGLSSAATASEPAVVSARCSVNGDRPAWQACVPASSGIWARPESSVDLFAVTIQHRFENTSLSPARFYNVTGNVTVDFEKQKMPLNTTVHGTEVSVMW